MQAGIGAMPGVWRGRDLAHGVRPGIASGYPALDTELPGGGWPAGAVTELLLAQDGGHLVAQAFAPARGHQHQRVAAGGHLLDDVGLLTAEGGVAKDC